MKKVKFIGVIIITLLFVGCSQSKLTPEELMQKIEKSGHQVKKDGIIVSMAQNSEVQFWLLIDEDRVAAYCFETPEMAKNKAQGFEAGYSNGCWAFDHIESETVAILEKAL